MYQPTISPSRTSAFRPRAIVPAMLLLLLALIAALPVAGPAPAAAQGDPENLPLSASQRVYDETGSSLSPDQTADLERRLADLLWLGADTFVYVQALDADNDETIDQVEELQRAWVQQTGSDPNTAVTILINRNPDDPNDARAGITVGRTFDDGNVPSDEQVAIINDALIPPLRDGNVYGSLVAGIDRLSSSIQFGPPVTPPNAFERWSANATDSWAPWAAIGAAFAGLLGALSLFRGRQTTTQPADPPTTRRPGDLPPAVAGALVSGGPQTSAIPATLLELAGRGALSIEPEGEAGRFSKPKIQIRPIDGRLVQNAVESALWVELDKLASDDVVSSQNLTKLSGKTRTIHAAIREQMRAHRWLNPAAGKARAGLFSIGFVALGLAIFLGVIASNGDNWRLAGAGIGALGLIFLVGVWLGATYSGLTREGQEAAIPWKAYRDGLKQAGKDETVALDLDATLPDIVALDLGSALDDRLKAAGSSGQTLRAFSGATGTDVATMAYFPYWIAFNSSVATTTASSSSTVSSSTSSGGGSAAGST